MLKSAKIRTKFKKNSNLKPLFLPFWPIFQHFVQSSLCLQIRATASLPNRNEYLTAHNPEQKTESPAKPCVEAGCSLIRRMTYAVTPPLTPDTVGMKCAVLTRD